MVARTLAFLTQSAHYRFPPSQAARYEVVQRDGEFDVIENDILLASVPYPIDVLMLLDSQIYAPALAPFADTHAALLRGACVRIGETRLLFVGDNDARRTALLLRLLMEGAAVEGNWYVVLRDGSLTTVARSLRLSQEVVDELPAAAALVEGRPYVQDAVGSFIWNFEPVSSSGAWELDSEPVQAVVSVESNPGGRSRLESRPHYEVAQEVIASIAAFPADRHGSGLVGARIAAASTLVDSSSCWRLRLGDLDASSTLLLEAF